eukprot:m.262089 g.262089  ORF g.262089 m.262089 type:complete len:605 (-) comp16000_c0_seq10:358-2172(-)
MHAFNSGRRQRLVVVRVGAIGGGSGRRKRSPFTKPRRLRSVLAEELLGRFEHGGDHRWVGLRHVDVFKVVHLEGVVPGVGIELIRAISAPVSGQRLVIPGQPGGEPPFQRPHRVPHKVERASRGVVALISGGVEADSRGILAPAGWVLRERGGRDPVRRVGAGHERREVGSVDAFREWKPSQRGHSREDGDQIKQPVRAGAKGGGQPRGVDHQRHTHNQVEVALLLPLTVFSHVIPVIGVEEDERVIGQPGAFECLQNVAHVLVDVRDRRIVGVALVLHNPVRHGVKRVVLEGSAVLQLDVQGARPRDQRSIGRERLVLRNRDLAVVVQVPHPLGILPRSVGLPEAALDVKRPPGRLALVSSVAQVINRLQSELVIVNLLIRLHTVPTALTAVGAHTHGVGEVGLVGGPIRVDIPRPQILVERLPQTKRDVAVVPEVSRGSRCVERDSVDEIPDSKRVRPPPRHETHSGWGADRDLTKGVLEQHRLGGQRVQVWRLHRESIRPPVRTHVIRDKIQNIPAGLVLAVVWERNRGRWGRGGWGGRCSRDGAAHIVRPRICQLQPAIGQGMCRPARKRWCAPTNQPQCAVFGGIQHRHKKKGQERKKQ